MFSCEFYEIFKNIYYTEQLWTTASVLFFFINKQEWFNRRFACFSERKLVDLKDLKQVFKYLVVAFQKQSSGVLSKRNR